MLGRIVLTGAVIAALATPASAGSPSLFHLLKKVCPEASQTQCAIQAAFGDGNKAVTWQSTDRKHTNQFAVTLQHGDGNVAYTGQLANERWTSQVSLTVQNGNGNGAFTYQQGGDGYSQIVQNGNGIWSASSSIGDDTYVNINVSN